ncbi:MAG: hypothetical protein V3U98_02420 [Acidobacteriota bacterium]
MDFDFHRRCLGLSLRLIGSDPIVSRTLMKRWRASFGPHSGQEPAGLKLPRVSLMELVGFDVQLHIEHENRAVKRTRVPDGCVLVIGSSATRSQALYFLKHRAAQSGCSGPILWTTEAGWDARLAAAARQAGIGDNVLQGGVGSREGALLCLEVALACLIDDLLLRVHPVPVRPGERAPEPAVVIQRLRAWTRWLAEPGELRLRMPAPLDRCGFSARGSALRAGIGTLNESWRRRVLALERIKPLAATEAAREIEQLDRIVAFSPPLARWSDVAKGNEVDPRSPARGSRRR